MPKWLVNGHQQKVMKLYYFNPNTYGGQAFVMAESLEKAKEYILKAKKEPNLLDFGDGERAIDLNQFHNERMEDMANLRNGYTVEEFDVGHVVLAEIS